MRIFDDDDQPLVAEFLVEGSTEGATGTIDVVLASSGGRSRPGAVPRNRDYAPGLLVLLGRLAAHGAVLLDASVDSSRARKLPESDRRLQLRRHVLPLALRSVTDLQDLRLDLTYSQRTVARAPTAVKDGNNRKRLRLRLFPGTAPSDPVSLGLLLSRPSNRGSVRNAAGPEHGQGLLDAPARRAVELHAMRLAEAHYRERGWSVSDVSTRESFDLYCSRGDGDLRVEVKGTTGGPGQIRLTGNEVSHALANRGSVALFVVHGITLDRSRDAPVTSGGDVLVLEPWQLDPDRLTPVTWLYALDGVSPRADR